ncbi:MAG TPA: ATPase, T2SS/T4P/T4SS family [Verrucomicrobiota bacterium]|nr:ATPase, T2SS/T4P/T4SS family [Verrucomicrobiota bacterium]HNU52861.1 ATPase, T2SS/T4P/T4SS family [Verrucomicrobiota bacterium]
MESESAKREVGDLLLEQGKLTAAQLETVRRRQQRWHVPQHAAILTLNYASEEDTYRALAALHQIEFVDLATHALPADFKDMVPVAVMLHHRVLPIGIDGETLVLAFADPPRQAEVSNLRLLLNRKLRAALTTPSGLRAVIKRHFGLGAETIQRLREDRGLHETAEEIVFDVATGDSEAAVDASIARFVDQILSEALRLQATDIHLEPYYAAVKLRYRIDGVMQTVPVPAELREVYASLVSRLKIMAGLNIAEKRIPHDGRISMKTEKDDYDLRVSIVPTKHGEGVCLRLLGRQSLYLDLAELGLEPAQEALIRELTQLPQGLVLLTGPTGSGKTTTLYAALAHANDEGRKIITIEDPVEYQLEGVVQIQAREEVGLSFASGLRSILRHDPDVVLIGEIRDPETAEIAVRAAQTGHLVFSTLHTNDSISAITRLLDMGIDPFLLGSSLVCSIAQRLAQRICPHCRQPDPDLPADLREEQAQALGISPDAVQASRGAGCVECNQKGNRGRVALYEFFIMTEDVADLLGPSIRAGQLRAAARTHGWRSLRHQGWSKVQAGLVSVPELQRLTRRIRTAAAQ